MRQQADFNTSLASADVASIRRLRRAIVEGRVHVDFSQIRHPDDGIAGEPGVDPYVSPLQPPEFRVRHKTRPPRAPKGQRWAVDGRLPGFKNADQLDHRIVGLKAIADACGLGGKALSCAMKDSAEVRRWIFSEKQGGRVRYWTTVESLLMGLMPALSWRASESKVR